MGEQTVSVVEECIIIAIIKLSDWVAQNPSSVSHTC